MKREKTNKMQQSDVYYQLLSQHVSGIIMPIFRRTKAVCHCIWCTALVLLDVVGSGCGALRCRMRALCVTPAPHTPPIKQAQHMHQNTRSRYTRPEKRTRQIPVQCYGTPICTRHSHIHTRSQPGLLHTTPQKRRYG